MLSLWPRKRLGEKLHHSCYGKIRFWTWTLHCLSSFPSVSSQTTGAASDPPSPLGGDPGKSWGSTSSAPGWAHPVVANQVLVVVSCKAAVGKDVLKKGRGAFLAQMAGISVTEASWTHCWKRVPKYSTKKSELGTGVTQPGERKGTSGARGGLPYPPCLRKWGTFSLARETFIIC